MIGILLLAGSIAASIPGAVEKTLACTTEFGAEEPCQFPEEDPARIALRLAELEAKLANVEKVADLTATCVRAAFTWAGADCISTAVGRKRCPTCVEQNVLAVDDLALMGMKLAGLGTQIYQCYTSAKKGEKPNRFVTWSIRALQGFAVASNACAAIKGEPCIKYRSEN